MPQQLLTGPLNLKQSRTNGIEILPPLIGQRHATTGAPEQPLAQIGFQLFDLVADRALGDGQFFRGR